MKDINIISQLRLLVFVPMLIIVGIFVVNISHSYVVMVKSKSLLEDTKKMQKIVSLIYELQIERGLSSGYLASDGKKFKEQLLEQQHKINKLLKMIKGNCKEINFARLKYIRKNILNLSLSTLNSFDYFSDLIKNMKINNLNSINQIEDYYIRDKFKFYIALINIEEGLGQLRGSINAILSQKEIDKNIYPRVVAAKNTYDISIHIFKMGISPEVRKRYEKIISTIEYKLVYQTINNVIKKENFDIHSDKWFNITTSVINKFHKIESFYINKINQKVEVNLHSSFVKLTINILMLFFIIIFLLMLEHKISKKISNNIQLLDEYKNAVDRSSIVSKTDIKGIITYVNDSFCNISGYSYNELIKKPHNIVRHKDMSAEAFKDMWEKLLKKEPWSGIVKNRKKDGSFYWVEATINPILNEDGSVEEYIAIRNDITDTIVLHEEIEKTQEDLIIRMGEIGETRSRETGFHVRRVAKYSEILAKYYGLNVEEVLYLVNASPMHDIGKVGIPDHILNKEDKLTKEEWCIMQTHSEIGYDIFKDTDKPLLKAAAIISYQHHEKFDGSGYPQGLIGENIHIYGRITAVADVFDALGSDRPYKKAWRNEDIFVVLKEESGKHFDPKLIDIFFKNLDEFLEIQKIYNGQSSHMNE